MSNLTALLKKWYETSTTRQKLVASLLAFSLLATGALFSLEGASGSAGDPLNSTPFYYAGVFVKLIGVLLLIVASSILLRRWMSLGPQGRAQRQMRVVETVRLSPKQALHLVTVGDQQFLIGATDQGIAMLSQVETSFQPEPESAPQPGLDFGAVLQSFNLPQGVESLKAKE